MSLTNGQYSGEELDGFPIFSLDCEFIGKSFEKADLQRLSEERLFVGLDRDGTLVPIYSDQSLALVDDRVRKIINQLTKLPQTTVSIVSARSAERLKKDYYSAEAILAGNYGLEVYFPDDTAVIQKEALEALPLLRSLRQLIADELESTLPICLDDHVLSLCLHYHLVPEHEQQIVHQKVAAFAKQFTGLQFRALPTSYEVLPPFDWSKGHSLSVIAQRLGLDDGKTCFLFIGDSEADEAAFQWCNEAGGISILVNSRVVEGSAAKYRVHSPGQVLAFLQYLTGSRN
ncbi:MAG TPA: trehalose-phosphatase [Candidatus Obscuribacter sp.]|nr:trehalose-phosphatase [Candidatus Obscuribacter sp.]